MKSFSEFLTESIRQYDFKIKVAGTLTDEQIDRLEAALEKWGVQSVTKPKVTPIQKHPTDFANLKEIEVSIIDATFDYPAAPHEIIARLADYCTIPQDHIRVFGADDQNQADLEDQVEKMEEIEDDKYQVQLTSPYPKSEKNLPAGDKSTQKFLKDQKRKPAFKVAGGATAKTTSTNDLPQGTTSPISGRKGK